MAISETANEQVWNSTIKTKYPCRYCEEGGHSTKTAAKHCVLKYFATQRFAASQKRDIEEDMQDVDFGE